ESGDSIELESVIYSFSKTPIAPDEFSFSNPMLTDLASFDVQEIGVDEDGEAALSSATQAFRIQDEIQPALPQGSISENFVFGFVPRSAVEEQGMYEPESLSEFQTEITGKIVGPITLVESREVYNAESGYVYTMGVVDPATAKPE